MLISILPLCSNVFVLWPRRCCSSFFFFNDTATTEIYTLSLHDALPIYRDLSLQFETRKIFKEYVALTAGVPDRDSDYIESRIGHHPHDRIKMISTEEEDDGKEACSYYEVIERFRGYGMCRIQPRTGRTHQIRVHLASIGCPVLADRIYSGRDSLRLSDLVPHLEPERDELLIGRQALHAHRLRFQHPRTRQIVDARAPLPVEFEPILTPLRLHR